MAEKETIKRFIVRDPHGHVEQEDSFSVVGDVEVTVDGNVGEPSAESTYENGQLKIDFHNMKGDPGNGITDIEVDEQEGDEAINTVTIKTEDNPEGTAFQVRNGSRGNGIVSISEQVSDQDGGVNTFTIADSDGTQYDIHTRNGRKGDKGDPGDSVIVGEGDLPLAHVTGQSTEKAISQKGFTDALEEQYTKVLEGQEGNYIKNMAINSSGAKFAKTGWGCFKEPIPCAPGDVITWTFKTVTESAQDIQLACYDANMNRIGGLGQNTQTTLKRTYTVPANGAYINASFQLSVVTPVVINSTDAYSKIEHFPALNDVDSFGEAITKLDSDVADIKTKDEHRIHVKKGYYLRASDGKVLISSTWMISENYIPCTAGSSVTFRYGTTSSTPGIIFYNENKEYVKTFVCNVSNGYRTVTAPENTAYVRVPFTATFNGNPNKTPLTINGVNYIVDDVSEILNVSSRVDVLENISEHRLQVKSGVAYDSNGNEKAVEGWSVCTNYIPVNTGDYVAYRYGVVGKDCNIIFYDADKRKIHNYTTTESSGVRYMTVPSDTAYIRTPFYKEFNGEPNTEPLYVNGVKYIVDEVSKIEQMEKDLYAKDESHGIIGEYYPEQAYDVATVMSVVPDSTHFKRLQFIHVSDNHGGDFGYAEDFIDHCSAKFLVNTGDLVSDKFTDSKATTLASAKAPSKPTYLVLGNHDYFRAPSKQDIFDAFWGDPETEGTLNYHNVQAGGIAVDKTYYSIDYGAENVKCIFLDLNDGNPDEGLSSVTDFTTGYFSQAQIEWFISELQAARTAGLHVCVFIHILGGVMDGNRVVSEFTDYWAVDRNCKYLFLPDLVDKFITGGDIEFTYKGNTYNATFSAGGHFVGWFCGHAHYDHVGWLRDYPNQFAVVITRPRYQWGYGGIYQSDKLGVHWNFVTVDTVHKRLSVYRVGQQKTVFGVDRKSFMVYYK